MKRTHRAYAITYTLGTTYCLNAAAVGTGHDLLVNPMSAAVAAFGAQFFASGNLSPDIDHTWAPGPPRRGYAIGGHRGLTHRPWFALILSFLWGLPGLYLVSRVPEASATISASLWAIWSFPLFGWWSHLSGDMIYGRIKVLGRARGLGWETGGLSETGRNRKGVKLWFGLRDPASKVCLFASAALALAHLALFAGFVG